MPDFIDRTGNKYGRWTVLYRTENIKDQEKSKDYDADPNKHTEIIHGDFYKYCMDMEITLKNNLKNL